MSGRAGDSWNLDALERALRDAHPSTLLVPPRILRRVIKRQRRLPFLALTSGVRKSYVTDGASLGRIVAGDELGLDGDAAWPETVILIARPAAEVFSEAPRHELLREYWALLFRASMVAALRRRQAEGALDDAALRDRIERIGRVAFEEVRAVLRHDGYLLPPFDERGAYEQFAGIFSELRRFTPALLPHVFPAIGHAGPVEEVLAHDVDVEALFRATRLGDAEEPRAVSLHEEEPEPEGEEEAEPGPPADVPRGRVRRMLRLADRARARGNVVRAAILRFRAAGHSKPLLAESLRASARSELEQLARRLQPALGLDAGEAERWRRGLPPLLVRAARGFWAAEARLLYDLQKVCVAHERPAFRLDLLGWAASFGRRPFRRPLPHLRVVLISNHLRRASRRLQAAVVSRDDRARLANLLHRSLAHAEVELREWFRPLILGTIDENGIRPRNVPERVARRKLVEELLDQIVRRGFLTIGDLRDACSRNHLKLPDLSGPAEFLRGDRLLRADKALAQSCDGVYRRGEVYLRWLQRLSALAFANGPGRVLTLYAALPYGGAFITLEGLQHIVGPILHYTAGVELELMNTGSWLVLGTVALGLVNFVRFRGSFLEAVRSIGRALRLVITGVPAWILRIPAVRWMIESRAGDLAWRFVLKPLVVIVPLWWLGRALGLDLGRARAGGLGMFALISVLLNTRLGRDAEEIVAEGAAWAWRHLFFDLLPGLFRLIMEFFGRVHEDVERVLYAVDEWLRFRAGQRRWMVAAKALLGAGWFVVAYLVRIYANLLIEPQVNPIKHFPVVTVSHKLMIFYLKKLTILIAAQFLFLGKYLANFIAGTTVLLLPGVFGFLVWELKENWRLYEANRPARLEPVIVGEHGETVGRLLRPGFHSGTIPKLYAKLRKSERRLVLRGRERAAFRHRERLHHLEEEVRRFVERNFLALAHESRSLGPLEIGLGTIDLATNGISVALRLPDEEGRLHILFEQRRGWLVGRVPDAAWAAGLSEPRRRALTAALAGLFALAGVELVPAEPAGEDDGRPVAELGDRRRGAAEDGTLLAAGPGGTDLLRPFRPAIADWSRWVEAWETDQRGSQIPAGALGNERLIPLPAARPSKAERRRASRRRC